MVEDKFFYNEAYLPTVIFCVFFKPCATFSSKTFVSYIFCISTSVETILPDFKQTVVASMKVQDIPTLKTALKYNCQKIFFITGVYKLIIIRISFFYFPNIEFGLFV
ncbi:hypothetical protein AB670_02499 [Chryseobacterium sp. MOF25P]|nr:hypothetical protein AB670_02499 [Chryseobacterium sp. MOF25P]OBW43971.1 hypothetical protein AB671_03963 [Chryseobacterium sp. BGARF1]